MIDKSTFKVGKEYIVYYNGLGNYYLQGVVLHKYGLVFDGKWCVSAISFISTERDEDDGIVGELFHIPLSDIWKVKVVDTEKEYVKNG